MFSLQASPKAPGFREKLPRAKSSEPSLNLANDPWFIYVRRESEGRFQTHHLKGSELNIK